MRIRTMTCLAVLIATQGSHGIAAQQDAGAWAEPVAARPGLILRMTGSGPQAASGGHLAGGMAIADGEYEGLSLVPNVEEHDLCVNSMTFAVGRGDFENAAAAAWRVEARLVEQLDDRVTFDLRWSRRVNRTDLEPADSVTMEERLVMREGDRGVLDLLRSSRPEATACDSFGVTYELTLDGPQHLREAAIGYDLWMLRRSATGALRSERVQLTTRQGEEAAFFFPPAPLGAGQGAGPAAALDMSVWGKVRGRVRGDGRLDLSVDAWTGIGHRRGSSRASAGGRTRLTMTPGETVEFEANVPRDSTLPELGDLGSVLAGQSTAVRITTRRLW